MWSLIIVIAIILTAVLVYAIKPKRPEHKGNVPKWHDLMTYITDDLYGCFNQAQVTKVLDGYKYDIETYRSDPVFFKQLNDFLISLGWQPLK